MSLDWGVGDIKDWREYCWEGEEGERQLNPVTNALIWETMVIGMNRITDKNWEEFAERVHISQQVYGALLRCEAGLIDDEGDELFVLPCDVKRHIGLHTNASPLTKAKFKTNMFKHLESKARMEVKEVE